MQQYTNIKLLLLLGALSFYAQVCSASDALQWDPAIVAQHKKNIPVYLRNRKIKQYALTAAVIGGTIGYLGYLWYADHTSDGSKPTPSPTSLVDQSAAHTGVNPATELNQANFSKLCDTLYKNKNNDWFLWTTMGGLQLPYAPRLTPLANAFKSTATWTGATFALQKATSIFKFREDMTWFYHEEKNLPTIAHYLEAYALNFDAAVAKKQTDMLPLKKQLLLETAHQYLDALMALYVFMDLKTQQILPKFPSTVRQELEARCNTLTTSVMQAGIELSKELNQIVTKITSDGIPSTDTARTLVMQTNNLVQALVASYVKLENAYIK